MKTNLLKSEQLSGILRKAAVISLVFTLAVGSTFFAYADEGKKEFEDVPADLFAKEAIDRVLNMNAMNGISETKFAPEKSLTRAEAVQIIFKLGHQIETDKLSAYTDVKRGSWYCAALDYATEKGIITGYPDGTFKPDKEVTYEEFCSMIAKYIMWGNKNFFEKTDMFEKNEPTCAKYNPWAKNAMILMADIMRLEPKYKEWLQTVDATKTINRGDAAIFTSFADTNYKVAGV